MLKTYREVGRIVMHLVTITSLALAMFHAKGAWDGITREFNACVLDLLFAVLAQLFLLGDFQVHKDE